MRLSERPEISIVLFVLLLVSCGADEVTRVAEGIVIPTATFLPTPSLAAGAPTSPPLTPTSAAETAVSQPTSTPLPTVTPLPTATPTLAPTATPQPEERIDLGNAELANGDFSGAVTQFETGLLVAALKPEEREAALYALGVAYVQDGRFTAALNTFNQLLATTAGDAPAAVYFYMGQALTATEDYRGALGAYQQYLDANPEMAAYVSPLMAEIYFILGERENGVAAAETAVTGPADRLTEFANRQQLAQLYTDDGRLEDVLAQVDAMLLLAQKEATRGQLTYQAGMLELQLGDSAAAYQRFQTGITQYPRAYESYLGLVQLVDAGVPVDEFQRGMVNYFAASYEPCVAAFDRYLTDAAEINNDAFLYRAYCYEGLGNLETALSVLDASLDPAKALFERAEMLARRPAFPEALDAYLTYVAAYPDGADAAAAVWQTAVLTAQLGDVDTAVIRYQALADLYPQHEDAAEALFEAGWLANGLGDVATAISAWQQAAEKYPSREFGAASMVWLLRTLPGLPAETQFASPAAAVTETVTAADLQTTVIELATSNTAVDYYALRAKGILAAERPFASDVPFVLPDGEETAVLQAEAEVWLQTRLELATDTAVSALSPELAGDIRLIMGEKLWEIGRRESAKLELESLRSDLSEDALSSYQLALYFRDLGLYRSSILAATTVLRLTGSDVYDAPRFIGQMAYPTYYADLAQPLAGQYGYDARLQFALLRQESLFESFARSGAAAQGLSQVIPDTGAYIAQRLNWPHYENDDLYKPYVGLNFGAYYLAQQLVAFDGDVHAALSAYNAGPGNAARWHNIAGDDLDLYVETVDFWETREYIKRIYTGYEIYVFLYSSE